MVTDVSEKEMKTKARWMDSFKHDLTERRLLGEEAQYLAVWKIQVRNVDPT